MLFLDTEFNGHGGVLISIALASTDGDEFYEVVKVPNIRHLHPWVAANVVPKLDKAPIGIEAVRSGLFRFLQERPGEPIFADWPADFVHLLNLFAKPDNPEQSYCPNLTMYLLHNVDYPHVKNHNALFDAKSLRDAYMAFNNVQTKQ